jgi:hypothetical protein
LSVYNVFGQKISNPTVQSAGRAIQINLQNQPAGIYYLNIKMRDINFSEKLIIR